MDRNYVAMTCALIRLTGDELLCLGGQRRVPPGSFGMMCHSIIHLPTLKKAILRGSQFYNILLGDICLRLHVRGDTARVAITWKASQDDNNRVASAGVMAIIHRFSCWLIDQRIPLTAAGFTHSAPDDLRYLDRLFDCPLEFSQAENSITFSARYLRHPVMRNELDLKALLHGAPASLFVLPGDAGTMATRVAAILGRNSARHLPEFLQVAEQLNLTPQTLHRRLKREGTSYQEIKDGVRCKAATRYLSRSQMSIGEIAQLTGFSEPSTFHRAFRKWTGLTPGEYRQRLS